MTTLVELISQRIIPEPRDRHEGKIIPLSASIPAKSEQPQNKYEAKVFNFLLANAAELDIKTVMKFTALLVDGAVELIDGRRLTLEIKFRMNWLKACQAEWQFRTFLKRHNAKAGPVAGGLVFFEEFSGAWQRPGKSKRFQDGWNHWYREGHSEVDGYRLHLLRLCGKKLECFPLAGAITAGSEP